MEIYKDRLYVYDFDDFEDCVFIKLNMNNEERFAMKKIDYVPIVDHEFLMQKIREKIGDNTPEKIYISTECLYNACINLSNVDAYKGFNFDAVSRCDSMFEGCYSLFDTGLFDNIYSGEWSKDFKFNRMFA